MNTPHDQLPLPTLEAAFDVTVRLGPLEDHGATSAGHRRVVPILGGRITGIVEAEILPGGADWQLVRSNGTIEIDGRYSARTASGDLLLLHARGVRTGSPEVLERLGRGEDVDPTAYYFRTTVAIETAAPSLVDLQRQLYVAAAQRRTDAVHYRAYRVS
ncbi:MULTISPECIES: DUF3237 domain-containing protein [unclassified Microbacterium]|uniref:DUF3237 domain-containing protein n=1 Tax=unclassified Microbacterium TaxID=2609290 RepID=UPI001604B7B8|nr:MULTISPECIES: DUF3237 domain-containing protein [unclassified Microbacterium]QNA93642.1 DUF3237 domain-containing protein [Microbacterium sp. Se63.02b]QYM63904.1 DUF3237 domain-containing protein [Microbacterium sp. Se5.02b]